LIVRDLTAIEGTGDTLSTFIAHEVGTLFGLQHIKWKGDINTSEGMEIFLRGEEEWMTSQQI
jgi:hypothetical protein